MGLIELFILALGLSMDAFAVSICKGLSVQKLEPKHCLICGVYFGGFQALMPADRLGTWHSFSVADYQCGSLDRIYSAGSDRCEYDKRVLRRRGRMSRCVLWV